MESEEKQAAPRDRRPKVPKWPVQSLPDDLLPSFMRGTFEKCARNDEGSLLMQIRRYHRLVSLLNPRSLYKSVDRVIYAFNRVIFEVRIRVKRIVYFCDRATPILNRPVRRDSLARLEKSLIYKSLINIKSGCNISQTRDYGYRFYSVRK